MYKYDQYEFPLQTFRCSTHVAYLSNCIDIFRPHTIGSNRKALLRYRHRFVPYSFHDSCIVHSPSFQQNTLGPDTVDFPINQQILHLKPKLIDRFQIIKIFIIALPSRHEHV